MAHPMDSTSIGSAELPNTPTPPTGQHGYLQNDDTDLISPISNLTLVGDNMDTPGRIRVKFEYLGERRVVLKNLPLSLSDINSSTLTIFGSSKPVFYRDERGRSYRIKSQTDLDRILEEIGPNKALRLFLDERGAAIYEPDPGELTGAERENQHFVDARPPPLRHCMSEVPGGSFVPTNDFPPAQDTQSLPTVFFNSPLSFLSSQEEPPPGVLFERQESTRSTTLRPGGGEFVPDNDWQAPFSIASTRPAIPTFDTPEPFHHPYSYEESSGPENSSVVSLDDLLEITTQRHVNGHEQDATSTASAPAAVTTQREETKASRAEPPNRTAHGTRPIGPKGYPLTRERNNSANTPSPGTGIPKNWCRGRQLGAGAFGRVFICTDRFTGQEFAVKQVEIGTQGNEMKKEVALLEKEIELLKSLRHERIVSYIDVHKESNSVWILMEYMPGGSLFQYVRENGALTEQLTRKYTQQVLEGIRFLHGQSIIHRDIKGANILRDSYGNVKLADFGASKRLQTIRSLSCLKSIHGTPYWMSPEVINGAGYNEKADIWSLGCTVIEMLTTKPPWADLEPMQALFRIVVSETGPTLPEDISTPCQRFLEYTFTRNTASRPSADALLRTEFIRATR